MKTKKLLALVLALLLALSAAACAPAETQEEAPSPTPEAAPNETPEGEGPAAASYTPGTYQATSAGMWGPLTVEAEFSEDAIVRVEVVDNVETAGISLWPINDIPAEIVKHQTLAVDTVSGVTMTSRAILTAVEDCVEQAGGDPSALQAPPVLDPVPTEYTADVVIVGGGGAGLSAANAAAEAGASVVIVEKAGVLGGNSVVAGGIYNAADPELQATVEMTDAYREEIEAALAEEPVNDVHAEIQQKLQEEYDAYLASGSTTLFDSPEWHALQTWIGGDRVGRLELIYTLTSNALDGLEWVEGMGYEIQDRIGQGSGSLYPRTHFSVLPNTWGIIKAFIENLETYDNVTIVYETTANELIMENGRVTGVKAAAKDGTEVTFSASNAVILATGGFAGNVEMRQEYCQGEKWPDLGPSLNTTNVASVTGDGIRMAEAIGASLIDMDQIQLLHITNPKTGISGDASVPQSTAGYILVNQEGNRFVREDGRRDEISQAIMAQTGGYSWLIQSADIITDPDTQTTTLGQTITYMLENHLADYTRADTLEELAEAIGVPYENLQSAIDDYNAHVASGEADEFGRVLLVNKLETGPWYAFTRAPAAHHTMGGVEIDTEAHVLSTEGSIIPGLFAAGEVTGGIHGGNRLGGNAIVDFVVYGRIAGANAAQG